MIGPLIKLLTILAILDRLPVLKGLILAALCKFMQIKKKWDTSQNFYPLLGTVAIAMSGARAPQNLFGCNDVDPSLPNDCYQQRDRVVLDGKYDMSLSMENSDLKVRLNPRK